MLPFDVCLRESTMPQCEETLLAQLVKTPPAMQKTPACILGREHSSGEGIGYPLQDLWASLVAQTVKNPPTVWYTWVRSLS